MKSVSYTTSILIQYKNRYKLIWNSKKYRVNKRILNYKERGYVNKKHILNDVFGMIGAFSFCDNVNSYAMKNYL